MTTREFVYKALTGTTKKDYCSSVMAISPTGKTEDITVYSYGTHYPLVTIYDGKAFVNDVGYSNSTSKHINWAWTAASEIVGYKNVYHAPIYHKYKGEVLPGGLSLTSIKLSAQARASELRGEMRAKKRKDTQVYEYLQRQLDNMNATLKAVKQIEESK